MNSLDGLNLNISKWKVEADSAHNDGWTQNYYRKKLLKIKKKFMEYSNNIPDYNIHGKNKKD
jgi:hypothetical protein